MVDSLLHSLVPWLLLWMKLLQKCCRLFDFWCWCLYTADDSTFVGMLHASGLVVLWWTMLIRLRFHRFCSRRHMAFWLGGLESWLLLAAWIWVEILMWRIGSLQIAWTLSLECRPSCLASRSHSYDLALYRLVDGQILPSWVWERFHWPPPTELLVHPYCSSSFAFSASAASNSKIARVPYLHQLHFLYPHLHLFSPSPPGQTRLLGREQ